MLKFRTENALFGYFCLEFENNIVIFEISTLVFCLIVIFREEFKMLKCLIWVFLG